MTVRPGKTRFGGIAVDAVEEIGGAGVVIHVEGHPVRYVPDVEPILSFPYGQLRCSNVGCYTPPLNFVGPKTIIFPWAPAPGWTVWNPTPLGDPMPDEIRVKVRCPRCADRDQKRFGAFFG